MPMSEAKVPGLVPTTPVLLVHPAGNWDGCPVSNVHKPMVSARTDETVKTEAKTEVKSSLLAAFCIIDLQG